MPRLLITLLAATAAAAAVALPAIGADGANSPSPAKRAVVKKAAADDKWQAAFAACLRARGIDVPADVGDVGVWLKRHYAENRSRFEAVLPACKEATAKAIGDVEHPRKAGACGVEPASGNKPAPGDKQAPGDEQVQPET